MSQVRVVSPRASAIWMCRSCAAPPETPLTQDLRGTRRASAVPVAALHQRSSRVILRTWKPAEIPGVLSARDPSPGWPSSPGGAYPLDSPTTPADFVSRWEKEIPMRRLGEPREFAALAAFMVSERASYITGTSIPVDGGWIRSLL